MLSIYSRQVIQMYRVCVGQILLGIWTSRFVVPATQVWYINFPCILLKAVPLRAKRDSPPYLSNGTVPLFCQCDAEPGGRFSEQSAGQAWHGKPCCTTSYLILWYTLSLLSKTVRDLQGFASPLKINVMSPLSHLMSLKSTRVVSILKWWRRTSQTKHLQNYMQAFTGPWQNDEFVKFWKTLCCSTPLDTKYTTCPQKHGPYVTNLMQEPFLCILHTSEGNILETSGTATRQQRGTHTSLGQEETLYSQPPYDQQWGGGVYTNWPQLWKSHFSSR